MRFQCSNCFSVVSIDNSEAGQAVACGQCDSVVVVPRHPTAPGSVIGDFVIEKEIAQGGLATVYRAHQISLDRVAALKILHEKHASDPDYIDNFISEARSAAQLNHPNIVQAYAVGEDGGYHYFAMEFIEGTSLKNLLAHSGRLVVDRALTITAEICKALDFAWSNRQLVHRDIKPDNIILMESGHVKLADLGLAKLGKDFLKKDESEVFGTPQYISPELLVGQSADNRSDIYSLGATLYHAVTGQYPYSGNSAGELARKHVTDRLRPPSSLVPDLPKAVSGMIQVMMAKRPGQRYQSAAEVLKEIERYHAGTPMQRRAEAQLQDPIDLNAIETELAKTYAPQKASLSASPKGKKAKGEKKVAAESGKAKATGKSVEKSKKDQASSSTETAGKRSGGKKLKVGKKRTLKTGRKAASFKKQGGKNGKPASDTAAEPTESPAVSPPAGDQEQKPQTESTAATESAPRKVTVSASGSSRKVKASTGKAKRKSGSGRLVAVIGIVMLLSVVTVVSIILFQDDKTEEYSKEQRQALATLKMAVREGEYYDTVLTKASETLSKYPDDEKYRTEIKKLIQPKIEEQIREKRSELHSAEMTAWQKEARRIENEKLQAEKERRRQELQAEKERQQRLAREEEEKERQAYIEKMQQRKDEVRRESVQLCRDQEFGKAKILFAEFLVSREPEFQEWGRLKRKTINKAQKAFELVWNSGDLLKGMNLDITIKGRQPHIISIGRRELKAAVREKIYERGEFVREEVETFSFKIEELSGPVLLDLIKKAWEEKNPDANIRERELLVGAYLLATGQNLEGATEYLLNAGQPSVTDDMLAELEKVSELLADNG